MTTFKEYIKEFEYDDEQERLDKLRYLHLRNYNEKRAQEMIKLESKIALARAARYKASLAYYDKFINEYQFTIGRIPRYGTHNGTKHNPRRSIIRYCVHCRQPFIIKGNRAKTCSADCKAEKNKHYYYMNSSKYYETYARNTAKSNAKKLERMKTDWSYRSKINMQYNYWFEDRYQNDVNFRQAKRSRDGHTIGTPLKKSDGTIDEMREFKAVQRLLAKAGLPNKRGRLHWHERNKKKNYWLPDEITDSHKAEEYWDEVDY